MAEKWEVILTTLSCYPSPGMIPPSVSLKNIPAFRTMKFIFPIRYGNTESLKDYPLAESDPLFSANLQAKNHRLRIDRSIRNQLVHTKILQVWSGAKKSTSQRVLFFDFQTKHNGSVRWKKHEETIHLEKYYNMFNFLGETSAN